MNFKIDENLPVEFAKTLKSSGYEAMTVFEQGLNGKADSEVINKCLEENFILVTLDLDFADIKLYSINRCPGIITIRAKYQDKRHLLNMLKNIIPNLKHEKIEGKLWIVEENKIRIRDN